jgi:hypothetical protein
MTREQWTYNFELDRLACLAKRKNDPIALLLIELGKALRIPSERILNTEAVRQLREHDYAR